ncbi:polysaccharide biosynthesis protein [Paenibacillus sp. SYP-B3998]|uniref:Polysaccharide biosynthesis protein n=1 Tax=Paenibacillus sp. SYP-B3998 TaxID=2678564 RepID=A0A6G4A296_9BACL|nr:polysaccharide biosynthesis protein [Paenibacillus sp. SYP-B3998]NEW08512.1 polysaccharide biosynthesis protein [Paenibacillus sp. SYP-B3998]
MTATTEKLHAFFSNKSVLVTGGTGSIGQGIVEKVLSFKPKRIVVFNKDDSKQYMMKLRYQHEPIVSFYLGDIRDYADVEDATVGVDIIFHTAALKHVSICESFPFEAVKTNIIGSEHVVRAAIRNGVQTVVNISTDKAVNPYNTLGASKLIAEKLFTQGNSHPMNRHTKLCTIRFGNVMGSRGSVLPIFFDQALRGDALTVTLMEMTRFFITIPDAVDRIVKAACYCQGGETFVLKMKAFRIGDLAQVVCDYFNERATVTSIKIVGMRSGEKMNEELIFDNESEQLYEDDELLMIRGPHAQVPYLHFKPSSVQVYRSDQDVRVGQSELKSIVASLHQRSLLYRDEGTL